MDNSTGGAHPIDLYVTVNDKIYVVMQSSQQLQVWKEHNGLPTMTFIMNSPVLLALFATINGDIYFENIGYQNRVDKWIGNANASVPVMFTNRTCCGLFVDVIDNLYCSLESTEQVVRRSPNETISSVVVVAGNGNPGSALDTLDGPRGLFVDTNFDLYVADAFNNRVQLFPHGQLMGTTVVGTGASGTISLNTPTDVILDASRYVYIVEYNGHRVVASGPNGFRCIIACTGIGGSGR